MKFSEHELQEEVSRAVKDYVDGLIQQRRETGGMALQQNKLAFQGQSPRPKETEQLIQSSRSPPNKLLKNRSKANSNKLVSIDKKIRSKSVPVSRPGEKEGGVNLHLSPVPQKNLSNDHDQDPQQLTMFETPGEKKEGEDHWVVWRKSVKNNGEKRAPSAPLRSLILRPAAPIRTPSIPKPPHLSSSGTSTPPDRPVSGTATVPNSSEATPVTLPKATDSGNRPTTAKRSRPPTRPPSGTRQPTPSEFDANKKDGFTSPAVPPAFMQEAFKENGSCKLTGVDDWLNGSDKYEREVAYKLMKSTRGNKSTTSELIRAKQRARGKYTDTPSHRPGVANPRDPGSAKNGQPSLESLIYQAVQKALDKYDQRHLMSQHDFPRQDSARPRAQHVSKMMRNEEYIHEGSIFTTANGPFRSSFIIHPEWVSEKKSRGRIKASTNPALYRPAEEHRYSTAMPMYKCN